VYWAVLLWVNFSFWRCCSSLYWWTLVLLTAFFFAETALTPGFDRLELLWQTGKLPRQSAAGVEAAAEQKKKAA
jgi:hypothetical protein